MSNLGSFVWSIADQLRGVYKPHQYGGVILPFTILRRLDCILEPTRDEVRAMAKQYDDGALDVQVRQKTGFRFYNTSEYDFAQLLAEPDQLRANLIDYISRFSSNIDVFERFKFDNEIATLDEKGRLYLVVSKFAEVDLHPDTVPNAEMGDLFEELIRKFAEASNEEAGEHYTPRDAIRLMVDLLFAEDTTALLEPGVVRSIYDPTAGTGGMLSVAEERLLERNPQARLALYGQEINDQSYAICKSDMIAKGQDASNIQLADTLADDRFAGRTFDFCMSNPPFGVDWRAAQSSVKGESARFPDGRFGHGLPRISDGQMLFLSHLAHKMRPRHEGGGRAGIVLNTAPLFAGHAGQGETEIRRWLLEADLVDAIVALPTHMFFNTALPTFVWILDNNKSELRRGKVQLIDGSDMYTRLVRSIGDKSREITQSHRDQILALYDGFTDGDHSRVFDTAAFGYWSVVVETPERAPNGRIITDRQGRPKPDKRIKAREKAENIPFTYGGNTRGDLARAETIQAFFEKEIAPNTPDAWIDERKTRVGYEIPFTRIFYRYRTPDSISRQEADLTPALADLHRLLEAANVDLRHRTDRHNPTGVDWLGDVPDSWSVGPLSQYFEERIETVSDREYAPLSVTKGGVVPQLETAVKTEDNDNRKLVKAGDFAINSRSDRKGSSGISDRDGSVSVVYTVLKLLDGVDPRYAHHLLRSVPFQEEYYRWGYGIVDDLWTTRFAAMKRILLALPPLEEQRRIAGLLDEQANTIAQAESLVNDAKTRLEQLTTGLVTGRLDARTGRADG